MNAETVRQINNWQKTCNADFYVYKKNYLYPVFRFYASECAGEFR